MCLNKKQLFSKILLELIMKYLQTYVYNCFSNKEMSLDFLEELSKYDKNIYYDIVIDKEDFVSQMVYLFLMASHFKIRLIVHNDNGEIIPYIRQLEEFRKYYIKPDMEFSPIYISNSFFILKKDNLYFFFNLGEKAVKFILPEKKKNKNTFCIFCNEDKKLSDSYIIRPHRFDVLEIEINK